VPDEALPFGEFKEWEFGRERRSAGLEHHTETKTVWVRSLVAGVSTRRALRGTGRTFRRNGVGGGAPPGR